MPVGSIIVWSTYDEPDEEETGKWLECNGQYVDPSLYPKLAQKMSCTPDYRGVFLRGYGSVISNHYGSVVHSSNNLGTLQGDSIRNIVGTFKSFDKNVEIWSGAVSKISRTNADLRNGTADDWGAIYEFNASRVVPTANENRPINRSVRYLIKAK